jgi:hypothetical protein
VKHVIQMNVSSIQDEQFLIPEYLFSEVEQFVIKELTMTMSDSC